jgi:hypothetical protein
MRDPRIIKMLFALFGFFITLFLLIIIFPKLTTFVKELDTPLGHAKEDYPLGEKYTYILKKNPEVKTNDFHLGKDTFYFIALEDDRESQHFSSGRQIGQTLVNLEPFVDKKVQIWGTHYTGAVMFLKESSLPFHVLGGNERAVIKVERIEEVK